MSNVLPIFGAVNFNVVQFWLKKVTISEYRIRKVRKAFLRLTILTVITVIFAINDSFSQKLRSKDKENVAADSLRDSLVVIDKIHIVGNKKTKRPIITRELSFHEGDTLRSSQVAELLRLSRNNVYNTNLFSTVEITLLETDSSHVEILIDVAERWYFIPSIVFRLIDPNFNEWWIDRDHDLSRTKYGVKLEQYNFRGRKEKLKLIALFGFENWYLLEYNIPYIDKSQKHGLGFGVDYQNNKRLGFNTFDHQDSVFKSEDQLRGVLTARVNYTYRPSFYNYNIFSLSTSFTDIADTLAVLNPSYLGDGKTEQNALKLSYTFLRDRRDNRNYPLNGYMTFGQIEKLGLGIFNDVDIWRFSANYNHYFDLGQHFYFSSSLSTQISSRRNVPYYNYISLGQGLYNIRGYELERIEGPLNIVSKNTFKKRLFKHVQDISPVMPLEKFQKIPFAFFGKVFFDGGSVDNYPNFETSDRLTNKFLYGAGVGLDIVTLYDMVFRVEYSYNAENEFNLFINFAAEL